MIKVFFFFNSLSRNYFIRDKGKKRDAFTSKDPNGILINAVIINQGDMSKEYLDLKFIYHYDEQRDHEREPINHSPHISYYFR